MNTPTPPDKKVVHLPETLTVKHFSELLDMPVTAVITELMRNKIMAAINDEIDFDTAAIIAEDLGFETAKDLTASGEDITLETLLEICQEEKKSGKNLQERPPIVTILGHVDHGKTTLLDTIRKANVAAGEVGGITQHISAYQVKKRGKQITFIDTPGHEAFSAMRERGVSLADIAILVVAADDGVRPQTEEVIAYLKEKNIPAIVAITKIDKPETNIPRVKQELSEREILIEEWGGKYMCVEVSGKSGKGVDNLLESILLLAEVEECKADMKRDGLGVVLESHLDPQRGPLATVLVKTGIFKVGQDIVAGKVAGRIRRMENWMGQTTETASPSMPVTVFGLAKTPQSNDVVRVSIERSGKRALAAGKASVKSVSDNDERKRFKIVVKADTQGSLEAVTQILDTYKSDEVALQYVETGVGNITESDVKHAESADTVVYGFNVEATSVSKRMAGEAGIEIKTYKIIYELVEDVKKRMEEMLEPEVIREDLGILEVLALFKTGKTDMIVGGKVASGLIRQGSFLEVQRGENIIGRGTLSILQKDKVPVDEVPAGNECGLTFEGETKIKEGDKLLCFTEETKKKTIETA